MHDAAFLLVLAAWGCGGKSEVPAPAAEAVSADLAGTSWVLEDLAGVPVVQRGRATLEFDASGRASGSGSCNRFSGPVTINGASLSFGPLMSTKMACVEESLTNQETAYLAALGAAERWVVEGSTLRVYFKGSGEPLRFSRTPPP
jgi:heat shock protein HslJ